MSLALSNIFYYQNPNTNQPSTNAVSAKQICRILCPSNQNSSQSFLNQSTLVIAFDAITNTHDSNGWKSINQVPLLKEACASWYYEDSGIHTTATPSTNQSTSATMGPISCRELASFYYKPEHNITNDTRVWSAQASSDGWKPMRELPDLMNAMEAEEIAEELHMHLINDRDNTILPCSATDKEGLADGIAWLEEVLSK